LILEPEKECGKPRADAWAAVDVARRSPKFGGVAGMLQRSAWSKTEAANFPLFSTNTGNPPLGRQF
jgi:hypothetical protein